MTPRCLVEAGVIAECQRCHGSGYDAEPHGADTCPECGGSGYFCTGLACDEQAYSRSEFRASYGPDVLTRCDECGGAR